MAQDRKLSHRENVQARVWLVGTTRWPKKDSLQFSRRPVWHVGDIAIEVGTRPTVTFGINLVPKIVPLPHSSSNSIRIRTQSGKYSNVACFYYIDFFLSIDLVLSSTYRSVAPATHLLRFIDMLSSAPPLTAYILDRIACMKQIDQRYLSKIYFHFLTLKNGVEMEL